jgi:hypothetical protein
MKNIERLDKNSELYFLNCSFMPFFIYFSCKKMHYCSQKLNIGLTI